MNNEKLCCGIDVSQNSLDVERLKSKGKSGKLALIAVCNKLLKQVFAVVKNNTFISQIIAQQDCKKDQILFGFLRSSCCVLVLFVYD
jgi:hypothetical protein